ncbi:MAG: endonuclease domain-containing protein [Longimicrobiales bacterium]
MSRPDRDARLTAEQMIMKLAARQHGVVARVQLLRAGVQPDLVDHRLRTGRLRRLHRGIYLAGPLTGPYTREMAAVLACGEHSAVSHRSAAALWQMLPPGQNGKPVEVVLTRGRGGRMPDIRVRHVHTIRADELTVRDGIPITTAARTLYDLAVLAGRRELERALAEALALRLVERSDVLALLDRRARRPGVSRLRGLVEGESRVALTRSEAEERFLTLIRKARLDDPDTNVEVAGHEVDFLWRAERLVVEVDGRAFHASYRRFESDRRRDAVLVAAGLRVIRVTWHQIVDEPEALLVRLAQALARPAQL